MFALQAVREERDEDRFYERHLTIGSRAARATRRYPSQRSNFVGVCRFCVGDTEDALAVRPT